MTRALVASCLVVLFAGHDRLFAQKLGSGESFDYDVQADAGEYVSVVAESSGIAFDAQVIMPDGLVMRRLTGPASGRLPIAFVAEASGRYRIRLTGRSTAGVGQVSIRVVERLSADLRVAARPIPLKSAVIAALEQDLKAGTIRDTTAFWDRVASTGTPVVETLPETKDFVLVTFLWRGTASTRNVTVVGSLALPPGFRYNLMSRVAGTDVWFLAKRLPAGARFSYGFSLDGPLAFEGPLFPYQAASRQADPLNAIKTACAPDATRFECLSVAELPGASPQPWIVPSAAVPRGTVRTMRIKSERLGNERSVSVFTPAGYEAGALDHDLLVLFDEGMYLGDVPTPTLLDNLIAARRIRPVVAVLVGNVNRDRELVPNPDFAAFVEHELMSWVRATYRVTRDPRRVVIGGSSLGGLAAASVAMQYPSTFGNVISLSGSYWWAPGARPGDPSNAAVETGWLTREYLRSPTLPLRFWMAAGTFESDPTGSGGGVLETTRHFRDVLLAKGYAVQHVQYPGGHDALSWRGLLPDALMALLAPGDPRLF
jgi:enterochelin esterase-like enzyme